MNIREFARLCGVSPGTVSRILNYSQKESRASAKRYEEIRRKAKELNFRPNYAAQAFLSKRSRTLGVVLGPTSAVYFSAFFRGASAILGSEGYLTVIAPCYEDVALQERAFEDMFYRGVDAIIWRPFLPNDDVKKRLAKLFAKRGKNTPIVTISRKEFSGIPGVSYVYGNVRQAAVESAERFWANGARRFAMLGDVSGFPSYRWGASAFFEALRNLGASNGDLHYFPRFERISEDDWKILAEVDAMWFNQFFYIYRFLPQLTERIDFSNVEAAGVCLEEEYVVLMFNASPDHKRLFWSDRFRSLTPYIAPSTEIVRQATRVAIDSVKNDSLEPCEICVEYREPTDDLDPWRLLFAGCRSRMCEENNFKAF